MESKAGHGYRLHRHGVIDLIDQMGDAGVHHIHKGRWRQPDPEDKEQQRGQGKNLPQIQVEQPFVGSRVIGPAPDHLLKHPQHVGGRQNCPGNGATGNDLVLSEGPDQDQKLTDKRVGSREGQRR